MQPHVERALQGLEEAERSALEGVIREHHLVPGSPTGTTTSLVTRHVEAPASAVWPILRSFGDPQVYKHFIRSCRLVAGDGASVGSVREVTVVSGLPGSTSTERLEVLDDDRHVISFSVIGGQQPLRNYQSVTSVTEFPRAAAPYCVVVESYMVNIPEGNDDEGIRLFADTFVNVNLQKLAEAATGAPSGPRQGRSG